MTKKVQNYEEVEHFPIDPDLQEKILLEQNECSFVWGPKDHWAVGVIMSYVWRDGKFWLTASSQRARIHAIKRDPRISLLFLIPGVNETLRINGRAEIVIDPELCASFAIKEKLPRSVLVITVARVYFQCQKALVRSRLWDVEAQIPRAELPSTGKMLAALSENDFDAEVYDRDYPKHLEKTIY